AIAGIDALDLARDEAVGDVAGIGAAIFLRQRHADQSELAHLVEDLAVGLFLEIGLDHARQQLVLRVGARGVADHALVFGELIVEQERIVPLEAGRRRLVLGLGAHAHGNPFRITVLLKIVGAQNNALSTEAQMYWNRIVIPGRIEDAHYGAPLS